MKWMEERFRKTVLGMLVLLSLLLPLKFTTPVILEHLVEFPRFEWSKNAFMEWNVGLWPDVIFYILFSPAVFLAILGGVFKKVKKTVWLLSSAFLIIQLFSTVMSVHVAMSWKVLWFFASLTAGYILGAWAIRDQEDLRLIIGAWVIASFLVIVEGVQQAMGGLEETRKFLYAHPELARSPEIWQKVQSTRIFATFSGYPNALGGYLIAAFFVIAAGFVYYISSFRKSSRSKIFVRLRAVFEKLFSAEQRFLFVSILTSLLILGLVYCLWKSGSKGSYFVLFITLGISVFLLEKRVLRRAMMVGILIFVAVAGFAIGYGMKGVEKGQRTLGARIVYWKAALEIGSQDPVLGTGPGTFSELYFPTMDPQNEYSRLAHNNYIQMFSDSGLLGFLTFTAWLPGSLFLWWRSHRNENIRERLPSLLIWCACVTLAVHSLVDFDLYILGNAWPIFVLLGYLTQSCKDPSVLQLKK